MTAIDAPGTCHQVGCPSKGKHQPHGIGAGTWKDYTEPQHCLGFPAVTAYTKSATVAICSLAAGWTVTSSLPVTPTVMAELVDRHRAECTNRSVCG